VKHFSEEAWLDFARNLVAPGTRATMQRHLDDGCKKCVATLEVWQAVALVAKQESAYVPPEDTVRVAKSQFAAIAADLKASQRARLVFDSFLQPAAAGLRGTVTARQFLYEADDYVIDLRLEPQRELDRISLVGQVLNRTRAIHNGQGVRMTNCAAQGILVRLLKGVLPVANTATNDFGEFQLEFEASNDLSVVIGMDEERVIVLPLHGVENKPVGRPKLD
jgi:hypothetical protein